MQRNPYVPELLWLLFCLATKCLSLSATTVSNYQTTANVELESDKDYEELRKKSNSSGATKSVNFNTFPARDGLWRLQKENMGKFN